MKITRGGGHYLSSGVTRNVDISVSNGNKSADVSSVLRDRVYCVCEAAESSLSADVRASRGI